MISSEVQRTLVKSPPELWAELSDPTALARHLGQLGEIRIVRTEPERTVEWAAENTTGTVSIKPSGWGTKVTLSVTCETAETPAADALEAEPGTAPTATAAELTTTVEPEPEPSAAVEPEPSADAGREPTAPSEAEPALSSEPGGEAPAPETELTAEPEPAPEPRRGFFARLFGRRRSPSPEPAPPIELTSTEQQLDGPVPEEPAARAPGQPDAFAAVTQALAPETFAAVHPFAPPAAATEPAPVDDISAELMAAEEVTAEQVSAEEVTAVLTGVLDRLGAAHHRPFSRS
jgi:hypothetical protein